MIDFDLSQKNEVFNNLNPFKVKAMTMMNSLIIHVFEKIATEASKIAKCNKKSGRLSKWCLKLASKN